jgi:hypothetical protein
MAKGKEGTSQNKLSAFGYFLGYPGMTSKVTAPK